ncbi:MAG: hypothetical protein IJO22_02090 [Oscillospiraceae bacterium]|nr:hypothetical protein [Oscillospiraceae bacterium]
MKKLLALILAMIMMLSFTGCGSVEEAKDELTIEDVVGYWESPNRVNYGTQGEVLWRDYTLTFFEDGSGIYTHIFNDEPTPTEGTFKYRIEGNKIIIPSSVGWEDTVYTYDNSGSTPKLMASMAEGYWYEKVSD